mgnify:CR=1 FL=1
MTGKAGDLAAAVAVILYIGFFVMVFFVEINDDTSESKSDEPVIVYFIEINDDTSESKSDEQDIPYIW